MLSQHSSIPCVCSCVIGTAPSVCVCLHVIGTIVLFFIVKLRNCTSWKEMTFRGQEKLTSILALCVCGSGDRLVECSPSDVEKYVTNLFSVPEGKR